MSRIWFPIRNRRGGIEFFEAMVLRVRIRCDLVTFIVSIGAHGIPPCPCGDFDRGVSRIGERRAPLVVA